MNSSYRQAGFSLIELMIALTLGALVSAAFISLFVSFRSAGGTSSGAAAIADHGRYALTFLEQAVRTAGYYSCGTNNDTPPTAMLNAPGGLALYYTFTQPMTGFEGKSGVGNTGPGNSVTIATAPLALDTSVGDWALPTTAQPNATQSLTQLFNDTGGALKGNDILVVRGSPVENQPTATAAVPYPTPIFVPTAITGSATTFPVTPSPGSLFTVGQLAAVSDCARATVIFQIGATSVLGTSGQVGEGIPGSTGTISSAGPLSNHGGTFNGVSFPLNVQVAMVDTAAYYIGVGEDGDGALFRASLLQNQGPNNLGAQMVPVELVPDIEAMQILYGVDPSGTVDGTGSMIATEYLTGDQVTDFTKVVSVKIGLLAASAPSSGVIGAAAVRLSTTQTFNLLGTTVTVPVAVDQAAGPRLRQVFEVTIAAHNVLN